LASIGTIVIGIEAQTGKFEKGLDHSGNALQRLEHQLHGAKLAIGALAATEIAEIFFKLGETVLEAGHKLAEFVEHSISNITQQSLLAARLGTTGEAFSGLAYGAKVSGVDVESLGLALQKMQVNLGDSLLAITPASKGLERLGLSAHDLAAMDPVAAFRLIAQQISQLPSDALKASVAVDIFGRSGAALLNVLNSGAEGIDKFAQEAADLHLTFGELDAAKVHEAHAAIIRVESALLGIGNILAIEVGPYIVALAEKFIHFATVSIDSGVLVHELLKNIGGAALFAAGAIQAMVDPLELSGDWSGELKGFFDDVSESADKFSEHLKEGKHDIAGIGEETVNLSGKIGDLTNSLQTQADTFGMSSRWVEFYKLMVKGATVADLELAASLARTLDAMDKQKAIDDIGNKLADQIDTYGMTSHEIEVYRAAQMGASEEDLAAISAMAQKLTELDAQKKAFDDQQKYYESLEKKAQQFYEQTRTPVEKYEEEIRQLQELLDNGLLDNDTFGRAVASATVKLSSGEKHETKFASAANLGSEQANDIIRQNRFGSSSSSPLDKLKDLGEKQLAQQIATNTNLAEVVRKIAVSEVVKI